MRRIERSALVPFSNSQMFALVNDVNAYPEFLPGCVGAELLSQGEGWLEARLELSRSGFKQSFVTRNELIFPSAITMTLTEGPFKTLVGEWQFCALSETACKIIFWLEFEFSNKLIGFAASKVFEQVASEQVDAMCQRAKIIYS